MISHSSAPNKSPARETARRRSLRVVAVLVLAAVALAAPCQAQPTKTLSAEMIAIAQDILAPHRDGTNPPAGVDPDTYRRALEILKREKLLGGDRPPRAATGLLAPLAKALALSSQAPKVAAELGAVRDALIRGDHVAAKRAIQAAYTKLGWTPPEDVLEDMLKAAAKAVGADADKSERFELAGTDYTISVTNSRASGQAEVEVVLKGADGKPARVVFKGKLATRPDSTGHELEVRAEPGKVQTYRAADSDKLRATLDGIWVDQDGQFWDILVWGEPITLTHKRPSAAPREYKGTINLGRIEAVFAITDPEHLSAHLPLKVRQQLAEKGLDFKIRLTIEDEKLLVGTWTSRHVTHNESGVLSIHHPYDEKLILKRSDKRRRDLAGRNPEEGP